jgi:hypothetical protein
MSDICFFALSVLYCIQDYSPAYTFEKISDSRKKFIGKLNLGCLKKLFWIKKLNFYSLYWNIFLVLLHISLP